MLEGNTAERRHAKFIPGGLTFQQTREAMLTDTFDEWLARVVCYAFSVPPLPFIQQQNRATAESAKEAALSEGLAPLMNWIKDIVDLLIERFWNCPDLEFCWGDHKEVDPASMASINSTYVRMGIKSIDEARAELGLDPLGMDARDLHRQRCGDDQGAGGPRVPPRHDGHPDRPRRQADPARASSPACPADAGPGRHGQGGQPGMPMGDDGSWMPDFRAALKPGWVPDFRQALTPEWIQGIREVLGADGQGQPGSDPAQQPDIRGALGLGDREQTEHPGRSRDARPQRRRHAGLPRPARRRRRLLHLGRVDGRDELAVGRSDQQGRRAAQRGARSRRRRRIGRRISAPVSTSLRRRLRSSTALSRFWVRRQHSEQLYKRDGRAGRDADDLANKG